MGSVDMGNVTPDMYERFENSTQQIVTNVTNLGELVADTTQKIVTNATFLSELMENSTQKIVTNATFLSELMENSTQQIETNVTNLSGLMKNSTQEIKAEVPSFGQFLWSTLKTILAEITDSDGNEFVHYVIIGLLGVIVILFIFLMILIIVCCCCKRPKHGREYKVNRRERACKCAKLDEEKGFREYKKDVQAFSGKKRRSSDFDLMDDKFRYD